jgi:hypothetical protein
MCPVKPGDVANRRSLVGPQCEAFQIAQGELLPTDTDRLPFSHSARPPHPPFTLRAHCDLAIPLSGSKKIGLNIQQRRQEMHWIGFYL